MHITHENFIPLTERTDLSLYLNGKARNIGGLTPLMFETSLQAQFLIPMAVSIAFGLAVATFLVLLLVPALLCLHEAVATRWEGRAARAVAGTG